MTGLRSEDHTTIGFPAYSLRQMEKIPRLALEGKSQLLILSTPNAARVLVLNRKLMADSWFFATFSG